MSGLRITVSLFFPVADALNHHVMQTKEQTKVEDILLMDYNGLYLDSESFVDMIELTIMNRFELNTLDGL